MIALARLEKIEGPACPACGCCDTELLRAAAMGGRESRECRHCSRRFSARPEGAAWPVEYLRVRCPKCKSKNTHVTSAPRPARYHRCDDCDHNFKSFEPLELETAAPKRTRDNQN